MKKEAMIRARIEPDIKQKAEAVFQKLGLSATEAIGLFYHQVYLRQGIPFEVNISPAASKSTLAEYARSALVTQSKAMSSGERLKAFLNHSYLLKKLEKAGLRAAAAKKGARK